VAIDPFTLIAQVVNFAILLLLLRALLFRPIQRVMAAREQRIAAAHDDAERARDEAEAQGEALRRERDELVARRWERLAEIDREVEAARDARLAEVRDEADAARAGWRDDLARQRRELEASLRSAMVALIADAVRRGWRELADEELEARALEAFAARLAELDPETRRALAAAAGAAPLRFATAFPPSADQREALVGAARSALGADADAPLAAEFVRDPGLVAGVTLRAGDLRVGWSVRAHVDDLERAWAAALTERSGADEDGGQGTAGEDAADVAGGPR